MFGPIAGIVADKVNCKFVCIFSDMVMGIVAMIYAMCKRDGQYFSTISNSIHNSVACSIRTACKNKWMDAVDQRWFIFSQSRYESIPLCRFSDVRSSNDIEGGVRNYD